MIPTFLLETDITPPCAMVDPDAFFIMDELDADKLGLPLAKTYGNEKAAKAVCAECPLKVPCAVYAIKTAPQGIWGGTTEVERNSIRRGRGVKIQRALGLAPTKRRKNGVK